MMMHEGGMRIERVDDTAQRLDEHYGLQCTTMDSDSGTNNDIAAGNGMDQGTGVGVNIETSAAAGPEAALRSSSASFDAVRKLLPTRHRFRVVDAQGRDIRLAQREDTAQAASQTSPGSYISSHPASSRVENDTASHSTRVERNPDSTGNDGVADECGKYDIQAQ